MIRTVLLVGMWIALQGELTVGNLVAGLLVVVAVGVLFPVHVDQGDGHRLHPVALLSFLGVLAVDLTRSTWTVLVAVVAPSPARTEARVVDVAISAHSTLVTSIVANSITLTPGTLTVDVRATPGGHELSIHVLGRIDDDDFVRSVRRLEARVVAAFTPQETR
jgi:multisubunit Na+/H+ antiporter MnhE subunit